MISNKVDVEQLYKTLIKIIERREGVKITYTLRRKDEEGK